MLKKTTIAALATSIVLATSTVSACGAVDACVDIFASFSGEVLIDAIRLDWSTDNEDSTIAYYKLRRYDCGTPSTCMVDVATISAVGSCGNVESYDYDDNPPEPYSDWTYSLELWRTNSTRACAADVVPE